MFSEINKCVIILLLALFVSNYARAQEVDEAQEIDGQQSLELGIEYLQQYFEKDPRWHVVNPETGKTVLGLIHFIEKQPVDTLINTLNRTLKDDSYRFVYRLHEHVPDSLEVPGFYRSELLNGELEKINQKLRKKYFEDELTVPVSVVSNLEERAGTIPQGEGFRLFDKGGIYQLPDSLILPEVIPDSLMQSPDDFRRFLKLDSIRVNYIEEKRRAYNDSVVNAYRDMLIDEYRHEQFRKEFDFASRHLKDSVQHNNYRVLKHYNDSVVQEVNHTIAYIIANLTEYADFIDSTQVTMTNLLGEKSSIILQNNNPYFLRFWLKNEQNDSLRLMVKSIDKSSMQLLIDDGVTFSRFRPRQTKEFDFSSLSKSVSGLTGVKERYQLLTPWHLTANGNIGFTQTYFENWKTGGQNALSLQIILTGSANYSRHDGKVKWNNSGEIRNGWVRPGGAEAETQKNADKFEITSRVGVSAVKKWFYSAELNSQTQLFNGYKYPTATNPDPISSFMAPIRTFIKVGMDYKPNNNFSLFLSPITAKNVFVRDTLKINQKAFGVEAGKRSFWEPGLNTDVFFRKAITPDITYETKYKMFINYLQPRGNLDVSWENLFVVKLTEHINMRMLLHFVYDEKVKFPVLDANGVKTGDKAKLQLQEYITVGFAYKVNKQVRRTRMKE